MAKRVRVKRHIRRTGLFGLGRRVVRPHTRRSPRRRRRR